MTNDTMPQDANTFIEQQLTYCLQQIAKHFKSDILSFNGPLLFGVDDVVRNAVENTQVNSKQKHIVIILTTFGGYIEPVHRIVDTLRHYYQQVTFIVPSHAFSAGTVLVMSGDAIYMDYYSHLGPIDPQVETNKGQPVPALGYLIQWQRLLDKAEKGTLTMAEMQLMISGFDQAELYKYEQERELSISFLKEWLTKYKFKNWKVTQTRKLKVTAKMRKNRAETIARKLNDPEKWHAHGHGISMAVLRKDLNLIIDDFSTDPQLSNDIKSYHSLLTDYMVKRQTEGVVHTPSAYTPFN